jgi:hypothetical protein
VPCHLGAQPAERLLDDDVRRGVDAALPLGPFDGLARPQPAQVLGEARRLPAIGVGVGAQPRREILRVVRDARIVVEKERRRVRGEPRGDAIDEGGLAGARRTGDRDDKWSRYRFSCPPAWGTAGAGVAFR